MAAIRQQALKGNNCFSFSTGTSSSDGKRSGRWGGGGFAHTPQFSVSGTQWQVGLEPQAPWRGAEPAASEPVPVVGGCPRFCPTWRNRDHSPFSGP